MKNVKNNIWDFIRNEHILCLIIFLYAISMLSVIKWGIPNVSHPFPYHMDEWHQLEAIRNTLRYGSPNIPGSAHGPMLQFILSGIYLIPFALSGIINPFVLTNPVSHLDIQEKLFIILRMNTLFFGIGTLMLISIIAHKYLKIRPFIPVILFVFTPIWLSLSNYYKYDIALVFWISASLLCFLRYFEKQTSKRFMFAAIISSLALSTKIAALPQIAIILISFFLFTKQWRKKKSYLVFGIIVFFATFLMLGSPDLFLTKTDYAEYFSSNLLTGPKLDANYLLGGPMISFMLFKLYPSTFGHFFYYFFLISIFFWSVFLTKQLLNKKNIQNKMELFLLLSLFFYVFSLFPLGLGASGNRLLVLLPFFALLCGGLVEKIIIYKKIFLFIFILLSLAQLYESSPYIYTKLKNSPQQQASTWLVSNIRQSTVIGLESIPIYQNLPELPLKEFYEVQYNPNTKTHFRYEVIDAKTTSFPKVVLITEAGFHKYYLKKSPKKDLIIRLEHEGYAATASFLPNQAVYRLFGNDLLYHLSGLNAAASITVYQKITTK